MPQKLKMLDLARFQVAALIVLATDDYQIFCKANEKVKNQHVKKNKRSGFGMGGGFEANQLEDQKKQVDALFELMKEKLCVEKIKSLEDIIKKMEDLDHAILEARNLKFDDKDTREALKQLLNVIHKVLEMLIEELRNEKQSDLELLCSHISVLHFILKEYSRNTMLQAKTVKILGIRFGGQKAKAYRDFCLTKHKTINKLRHELKEKSENQIETAIEKTTILLKELYLENEKFSKNNECHLDQILRTFTASLQK